MKPIARLLVLVLTVCVCSLTTGCHFHRYHESYYEYDDQDYHPRYGSHHD